jgi:purine catabolism regulator
MLTVAEALELEAFHGAQIVAGHRGTNRSIAWVHVVSGSDAADWLNGGELALTTIINMPPEQEEQRRYLHSMIDKGVVGLVVSVGQALNNVPEYLMDIADARRFPLIEIPYQTRFVDIARAVNERIVSENTAVLTRVIKIQKNLTELVLQGGGFSELAKTMADLLNHSISIETVDFEALASHNIGAVDEARRYTQQFGRTDPRLVNALEVQILPQIRRTRRHAYVPAMPDVGLQMERILAPVVVQGDIYGYIWVIADDRPLTDLDYMAIERGATIAALMMVHQEAVLSAEQTVKGNLLARLVQGEMSGRNVLTDQSLRFGVDLRQPYRAMLVEYPQATSQRILRLYRDVNNLFTAESKAALIGQYAGQIMLLAQTTEDPDKLIEDFRSVTSREGKARIGVSSVHDGARNVRVAYTQCREVLEITRRMHQHGPNVYFDHLGFLHALYHAGPKALEGNPHIPLLRELVKENQADLFNTLETYLDAGGNGVSTAELLHIHRSTLNYRLERIKDICKVDLSDPSVRMNLQVALKLLRLFEEE